MYFINLVRHFIFSWSRSLRSRARVRFSIALLLSGLGISLAVWFSGRETVEIAASPIKRQDKASPAILDPPTPDGLRALAGGREVRVVWVENDSAHRPDPFGVGAEHRLVGFDSTGGGYRIIQATPGNYSRPLITPNGKHVVYSDKGVVLKGRKRHHNPRIHMVSWDGSGRRDLGPGYAVDVGVDPDTGRIVVYALETLRPGNLPAPVGDRLVRMPLDQPEARDEMWGKTPLTADGIMFSRDAQRFSALFPLPNAGWGEPDGESHEVLVQGCWTGYAPDNSHIMALFSGTHTKLRFIDPFTHHSWQVPINTAPELVGHEVYHPRWSNHPRFFAITGPYPKDRTRSALGPTAIHRSGDKAEVYVLRFSAKLDRVEASLRLTHNQTGDFYPDVWVEGGFEAALALFPQRRLLSDKAASSGPVN